ncbi:MAG: UPF0149 family protein [Rhizobiales bacterium]|nr:UPF0149 family protein [Hyphomicrobiales bacterium]
MTADTLSTWLGFLTSPAAPKGAMSPMELDGYLTGIVVSPDLLLPSDWLDGIWGENEPTFDGLDQTQTIIAAVMDHYNAIIAALDAGFKQIEAKQSVDYRPLFLAASDKPNHEVVRTWARGFGKAMALTPERWSSLAENERLQPLLTPFIGFLDVKDPNFEPADNIDELLDEAATAIPRATIILRKIAQFRTEPTARRRRKIGRNDPCPCGSGLKYKRCCGADQAPPN